MLVTAYIIFIANFIFGLLVKLRVIDNSRFRRLHHLLYFLVIASLVATTVVASFGDIPSQAWAPACMTALLLAMPLFRGRSRGHWIYATLCAALYSGMVLAMNSKL